MTERDQLSSYGGKEGVLDLVNGNFTGHTESLSIQEARLIQEYEIENLNYANILKEVGRMPTRRMFVNEDPKDSISPLIEKDVFALSLGVRINEHGIQNEALFIDDGSIKEFRVEDGVIFSQKFSSGVKAPLQVYKELRPVLKGIFDSLIQSL